MFPLFNTIGNKSPGELIRSQDWNALVQAVDSLNQTVTAGFADVNARLDDLTTRVEAAETTVNNFATRFNTLLAEYYRVTLQTVRSTYALGERAEIIATVTDLFGQPIAFTNANRPWIDFVSTWGQFRVVTGFETRGGVGQRAISVRVNAQGVARVQLSADHVTDADDDEENEVESVLNTQVIEAGNVPIWQLITEAPNPIGAFAAYQPLSAQYDASPTYRHYVDKSYTYNHAGKYTVGIVDNIFTGTWEDYRSTVLAFVKNDSDALTPDPGRGFASTQITFRDWVSGWGGIYYLDIADTHPDVLDIGDRFREQFAEQLPFNPDEVYNIYKDKVRQDGIFARKQDYIKVNKALERVSPTTPAKSKALDAVRGGVKIEENMAFTAFAATDVEKQAAFNAATSGIAESSKVAAELGDQVSGIQRALVETDQQVTLIGGQVQTQTGQLDALFSDNGAINVLQRDVDSVRGNVSRFLDFNPSEVLQKAELLRDTNVQLMERVFEVINRNR